MVTAGDYRVVSGSNVTVSIEATDIEDSATVTVNVGYDPTVLQVVSCGNLVNEFGIGLCNPNFLSDTVRFGMIAPQGMSGDVNLAEIVFEAIGEVDEASPIDVEVVTIAATDSQPTRAKIVKGEVVISNRRISDLNGDGVIDSADRANINKRIYLPYISGN